MLRFFVSILLVCGCWAWCVAQASDDASDMLGQYPLRFAVIGDRTGSNQPGVYEEIVEEIQRLKPDFVLSVGDMIEGYTGDTVRVMNEWEEYLGLIERWTMPVYLTPGNHDIWDDSALPFYRRYVGDPYYSFGIRGVHFIVLDTGRYAAPEELGEEQLSWLAEDLITHANAQYTVVLFHIPYWIRTIAMGEPDTLHALFAEHGVDAVLNGHYHEYFSGEFDGILYTALGSSGGDCDPGPTGLAYHFMWVTVDGDGISMAPIRKDAVLPWDELSAPEFIFVQSCEDSGLAVSKPAVEDDLTIPRAEIAVTLRNLSERSALEDTLTWEVPGGWEVVPEELPVVVDPVAAFTAKFLVACTGPLYPTPTLSVKYPYAEGKEFKLQEELRVSRTAYAPRVTDPLTIDGQLSEDVWNRPTTEGFAPDGSPAQGEPASFYFAWDDSSLYLAVVCAEDSLESLAAAVSEHDGPIYAEDCVGYFLQPETADGPAYQVYFNPLGVAFDQRITVENGEGVAADRDWNGTYRVGSSRGDDHWAIEVGMPLSQLGAEGKAGRTWALNFRRKQHRLRTSVDWLVPISYNPRDYGVLLLME
jgi:3',5'-cyclic AMP phosphodiesterase CpdA